MNADPFFPQVRVLIILLQEPGAFNAMFQTARSLLAAGADVTWLVTEEHQSYLQNQGFCTIRIDRAESGIDFEQEDAHYHAMVDQALKQSKANLVLLDQIIWWLALPALLRSISIIGVSTTLAGSFTTRIPPVFSLSEPSSANPFQQLLNLGSWLWQFAWDHKASDNKRFDQLFLAKHWRHRKQTHQRAGVDVVPGEFGFRLLIPEIIMAPRCFDWPFARDRHYAGACFDSHRLDGFPPSHQGPPKPVTVPDHPALVYASLGSYARLCPGRGAFFSRLVKAMESRPHLHLLLQAVPEDGLSDELPENVTVVSWAPQLEALGKCQLFLTHGGLNSVREALWFGVPMLLFPFHNDGFGNAARARYHKIGQIGSIKRMDAEQIGLMIDEALVSKTMAKAAKKMSIRTRTESNSSLRFIRENMKI